MNTKLIVALVVVGVLAVTAVGLVAAQIATSNPNGTTNGAANNGFIGWLGNCLRFGSTPSYWDNSNPDCPKPTREHNRHRPIHKHDHNLSRQLWIRMRNDEILPLNHPLSCLKNLFSTNHATACAVKLFLFFA